MSLRSPVLQSIKRLNFVGEDLKGLFSNRDSAVELMKLAVVCREHVLLLGPPGSGKSELVARFAARVKARHFQYLLTRFTEPAELFGPLDLEKFKVGEYEVRTAGMLPEAEVAFLDEVFQASSAILNTLLGLVHERYFNNGARKMTVPLITLLGASNTLPDDPTLAAFSDRFALRLEIAPVPDEALADLLAKGWALEAQRMQAKAADPDALLDTAELLSLYQTLPSIDVKEVHPIFEELMRGLRTEGVTFSERRMIKGLKLIRGAALMEGRDAATPDDLWPISYMWSHPDDAPILRKLVEPHLSKEGGRTKLEKTHRSITEILEEIELLEGNAPSAGSDGAFIAHLSSLGRLRQEIIHFHAHETDLLKRVVNLVEERFKLKEEARV
jgi:MoxR-like ATPase